MNETMRAVVLSGPGRVENLVVTDRPVLATRPGWVRLAVRAFGLNRPELHTRLGLAEGVTFPRTYQASRPSSSSSTTASTSRARAAASRSGSRSRR